jgi:AAA15 family ATPase/GTPase
MLVYFKVGNFKSVKDPVVVNFTASSISEHRETNVAEVKRLSLLRSVLLYGHNASGKSNLLEALLLMRWFVLNSARLQAGDLIPIEPHLLDVESGERPSLFEISFFVGDQGYRYGFEANRIQVMQEWLFETRSNDDIPLFFRKGGQVQVVDPRRMENAEGLEKRMRNNALFLSVASQWNVQRAEQIINWFRSIIAINGMDDEFYKRTTLDLMKDAEMAKEVIEFMRRADIGIDSIAIGPKSSPRPSEKPSTGGITGKFEEELPFVFITHPRFDANGRQVGPVHFVMESQESQGTIKFFNLVGVFIQAIRENRLIVVDELDARLHSILTKAILKLFNSDKSGSTAQLLAASHDTALLDNTILRRDQICFIEKDKFGATGLTSLAEYKIRKEAPYDKNYLEGRFGAIPYIEEFESILKHA